MAFALYKLPFLSLQHAVLNLFPFELQCIQMYLCQCSFISLCVLKAFKEMHKESSYENRNIATSRGLVAFFVAEGLNDRKH